LSNRKVAILAPLLIWEPTVVWWLILADETNKNGDKTENVTHIKQNFILCDVSRINVICKTTFVH
jgi:hypothetical protein